MLGKQTAMLLMMATAIPSFFLGTLVSLYAGIQLHTTDCSSQISDLMIQQQAQNNEKECPPQTSNNKDKDGGGDVASEAKDLFPRDGFGYFLTGMATVSKSQFVETIDPGVPLDKPDKGASDVLIMYSHPNAMPKKFWKEDEGGGGDFSILSTNPRLDSAQEATENCEQLNLILADHSYRRQCFAIMPQYESYHIQKWMRMPERDESDKPKPLDPSLPLRLVSRGQVETGRDAFKPPKLEKTRQHWELLKRYLANVDDVLADLDPILKRIARSNTVIVMTVNFGQSELLTNFVCAAKSRGLNIDNIIVFPTDQEAADLATGLGLTAYYDHRVC